MLVPLAVRLASQFALSAALIAGLAATAEAAKKPPLGAVFYSGGSPRPGMVPDDNSAGAGEIKNATVVMTWGDDKRYDGRWRGSKCGDTSNAVPNNPSRPIQQLVGWSAGRLGPTYYLKKNGGSKIRSIIILDPGSGTELDCDKTVKAGEVLARWLQGDSQRRLLIISAASSSARPKPNDPPNKALRETYLSPKITGTPQEKQVSVCAALDGKNNLMAHDKRIPRRFDAIIGQPLGAGCPLKTALISDLPPASLITTGSPLPAAVNPQDVPPNTPIGSEPPATSGTGRPSVSVAQGPAAPSGFRYAITLSGFAANSSVSVSCFDSVNPGGFYTFSLATDGAGNASTSSYCYSGDGPDHWVIAGGVESNHVSWGGSSPPAANPPAPNPPAPAPTWNEQQGTHGANTFTNPYNASGMGPKIPAMSWVAVSCKVYAPQIVSANPDGYWYRIASAPWNNAYYAVANTFWNGDVPGQKPYTHNTDFAVPDC